MKENAFEVLNTFCKKSLIEGYGIHQLGSVADSAQIGLNLAKSDAQPSLWIVQLCRLEMAPLLNKYY